jgi:putative hemolysin
MSALSRLAAPLVWLLSASTDAALNLLRLKNAPQEGVTEDELRLLAREGLRVGVLHPAESAMVESVLALDKLRVSDLMTPRAKIIWIHVEEPHDRIWHKVVVSAHTTFPVYGDTRDNVLGVITVKAIYANLAAGVPVRVRDLMVSPLVVPSTQNALQLLETFKRAGRHLAMVVDEFGTITGVVTMHDVLEAIVGEFPSQGERLRPAARRREDGSWLVDAMIPIDQFAAEVKDFPLDPIEAREYETFAGFVVSRLGRVPREGDCFACGAFTVEIIDMDSHRVDKVLLLPAKKAG